MGVQSAAIVAGIVPIPQPVTIRTESGYNPETCTAAAVYASSSSSVVTSDLVTQTCQGDACRGCFYPRLIIVARTPEVGAAPDAERCSWIRLRSTLGAGGHSMH